MEIPIHIREEGQGLNGTDLFTIDTSFVRSEGNSLISEIGRQSKRKILFEITGVLITVTTLLFTFDKQIQFSIIHTPFVRTIDHALGLTFNPPDSAEDSADNLLYELNTLTPGKIVRLYRSPYDRLFKQY